MFQKRRTVKQNKTFFFFLYTFLRFWFHNSPKMHTTYFIITVTLTLTHGIINQLLLFFFLIPTNFASIDLLPPSVTICLLQPLTVYDCTPDINDPQIKYRKKQLTNSQRYCACKDDFKKTAFHDMKPKRSFNRPLIQYFFL